MSSDNPGYNPDPRDGPYGKFNLSEKFTTLPPYDEWNPNKLEDRLLENNILINEISGILYSTPINMVLLRQKVNSDKSVLNKYSSYTISKDYHLKGESDPPLHKAISLQNYDYAFHVHPKFKIRNNIELIDLLATNVNINMISPTFFYRELTPLSMIMYSLHYKCMTQDLYNVRKSGYSPIDNNNRPPLDNIKERNDMILKLLEKGADVNIKDSRGNYVWEYYYDIENKDTNFAYIYPDVIAEIFKRINDFSTEAYRKLKNESRNFRTNPQYGLNNPLIHLYPREVENLTRKDGEQIFYGNEIAYIIDSLPEYDPELGMQLLNKTETMPSAAKKKESESSNLDNIFSSFMTRKNKAKVYPEDTSSKPGGKKKNKTAKRRISPKTAKRRRRQRK